MWPWVKVKVIGPAKCILTFNWTIFTANLKGIAWTVSKVIEHYVIFTIKLCDTLNDGQGQCTLCTVSILKAVATLVSEIWLPRKQTDRHRHTHTHTHSHTYYLASSVYKPLQICMTSKTQQQMERNTHKRWTIYVYELSAHMPPTLTKG